MRTLFVCLLVLLSESARADAISIAVASNFATTMKTLASNFEQTSEHTLVISYGSTGKHYAQIYNGAPFDAFFAADSKRPALLEQQGLIVDGSRLSYALGRLVLWSPQIQVDQPEIILKQAKFNHLAIANPRLAPYGLAAKQALISLGLWQHLMKQLVFGENINQTLQFIASGNAELGIIARSQFNHITYIGYYWHIPDDMHEPIVQQAVLLKDSEATRKLWDYMSSKQARDTIRNAGYEVP